MQKSRTVPRPAPVETARHLPLVDLLVDARSELFELAVRSGLKVLETMLEEDRTAICGPRMRISPTGRPCGRAPSRARSAAHRADRGTWVCRTRSRRRGRRVRRQRRGHLPETTSSPSRDSDRVMPRAQRRRCACAPRRAWAPTLSRARWTDPSTQFRLSLSVRVGSNLRGVSAGAPGRADDAASVTSDPANVSYR
jgi:hypothetical protein